MSQAAAATCNSGYKYSGEINNNTNLEGLQGEFGKAGDQDLNDAIHIINYYDMTDDRTACGGEPACWLQGGHGQGNVGGYTSPSGRHAYYERNDVNGYNVNWKTTEDVTGTTHSAYISITYIASSGGDNEYELDSYTNEGEFTLGAAWLAYLDEDGFISTEEEYGSDSVTCASFDSPIYYGANSTGGYDSGTLIEASANKSVTFGTIGDTNWSKYGPDANMTYAEVNGHRSAFEVND
jgi:hypothetical protein